MPGPSAKDAILEVVQSRGERGVTVREIMERLQLPRRTAYRVVSELESEGKVNRPAHGVIRVPTATPKLPTPEADRLWRLLREQDRPAYLTGLDVVGGFAHHFLMDFPHVVVAAPGTGDDLAFDATAEGFVVVSRAADVAIGERTNLLIVRERRRWQRYAIVDHVAPPELAWVDLYRDAAKGLVPVDPWEVGAILRNLLDAGFSKKRLRTFARDASPEILAVLDGQPQTPFGRAVLEGARA